MKAIINNKVFDTEKAEKIKTYQETYRINGTKLLGYEMSRNQSRECILYKTEKGPWFKHMEKMEGITNSKEEIAEVTEEDVKDTFKQLSDVDNYQKYFGELEEA